MSRIDGGVLVVCTGNVARSPAIAILLQRARPDLHVISAALGSKATAGRRMARPMRLLLTLAGLGAEAEAHRSQLVTDEMMEQYFCAIAPTRTHVVRLRQRGFAGVIWEFERVPDPAFGGVPAYDEVWPIINRVAANAARVIPKVEHS